MHLTFSAYYTLIFAALVLLLGKWLVRHLRLLREFKSPSPWPRLVVAVALFVLNQTLGYLQLQQRAADGLHAGVFLVHRLTHSNCAKAAVRCCCSWPWSPSSSACRIWSA